MQVAMHGIMVNDLYDKNHGVWSASWSPAMTFYDTQDSKELVLKIHQKVDHTLPSNNYVSAV